ncbi:MAG TPA: DUF4012 domain-containing protein [Patescibacteria group bacterium]|nr:DUF4012 domain-containing protein [Patescibacteria group bacterium]
MEKLKIFLSNAWWLVKKKKKIAIAILIVIILIVGGLATLKSSNKVNLGIKSLSILNKVSQLLPITSDEKKELEVVGKLTEALSAKDDKERTFMLFLQNNMELRPGGGFLGQYAIVKVKNGEVTSNFVEDANLLDQRIDAKVSPPYPFKRMLQVKKWKFRDSNFSPNFPTNIEKAQYFYKLSGRSGSFDGFIAVNTQVFNDILSLTGPISVPDYPGEYTSTDGALKLEEFVEKQYIMDPELDTQNRKLILKKMAPIIIDKLFTLGNITKLAEMGHNELKNKNIMLNFTDPELQGLVESVHWDGKVSSDWSGDFLMLVDANMGSMKSDYYIKRSFEYYVDLTTEKPTATLNILYKHTATGGDWRTSDYHSFLRIYTPIGSNFIERQMLGYPNITEEFNKTVFGVLAHTLINGETKGIFKYELPETLDRQNYKLLIQKQSGVGDIPVKITVKTNDGETTQEQILKSDLKFELQKK